VTAVIVTALRYQPETFASDLGDVTCDAALLAMLFLLLLMLLTDRMRRRMNVV